MNFKVVHSIPGRMRIHVPIVKKLPKEWHLEDSYFSVVHKIKGISKFEFSYVTCNALIQYDPAITNEKTIILNLKEVASITNKNKKVLSQFSHEEKEAAVACFQDIIDNEFKCIEMR